jgi:cytochrome c5
MSSKQEDFTRVFIWVLAGLVLFTIVVMLVARSVGMDENSGPMTDQDIDERTRPYGSVKVAGSDEGSADQATSEPAPSPAAAEPAASAPEPMAAAPQAPATEPAETAIDGEALYSACAACHATGAAGAPIVGNADAWAPRIANGMDTLVSNAINGKGAMPPKGGSMNLNDAQIAAIVEYMVSKSQ